VTTRGFYPGKHPSSALQIQKFTQRVNMAVSSPNASLGFGASIFLAVSSIRRDLLPDFRRSSLARCHSRRTSFHVPPIKPRNTHQSRDFRGHRTDSRRPRKGSRTIIIPVALILSLSVRKSPAFAVTTLVPGQRTFFFFLFVCFLSRRPDR